jgi:hypothetical protein
LEISLLLDSCEKTQSDIIGVLIDVNKNHINPQLVDPEMLQAEIWKANYELPQGYNLPGWKKKSFSNDIYKTMQGRASIIYKLIPVLVVLANSKMIVDMKKDLMI